MVFELINYKVCEIFLYKHAETAETVEYVKN